MHMDRPTSRMYRVAGDQPSPRFPLGKRTDFYREEFLKHRRCLEWQREYFSERAISEVECVLTRILMDLDRLCCRDDVDGHVSELLRKLDMVTGLSGWSDPGSLH